MKNNLKSMVCALLLLLGVAAGHAQTDGLTVSKLTFDTSLNLWMLDLGLENPDRAYLSFQCDLALPQAMTFKGSRKNSKRIYTLEDEMTGDLMLSHKFQQNFLQNGCLRVLVSSDKNLDFAGTTGTLYTLRFADNGTLDKSKSYDINLTNVELVYRKTTGELAGYRHPGIINDPSLRCLDALCNVPSVYGYISQKDLEWMNTALINNANTVSVDLTHCTNASLGTLYVKNPNTVIFVAKENQVGDNQNVVYNGECSDLRLTDKMPYGPQRSFSVKSATYTMSIGEAGYATVVLPYSCAVPQGLEAYRLTRVADDRVVWGEVVHGIDAHQPVLLKGAPGAYAFQATAQTVTQAPEIMENGLMVGTYQPELVKENNYLLQRHAEGVAFYRVAAGTQPGMRPFRAYLTGAEQGAAWLSIALEEPTGIESLQHEDGIIAIYGLDGQRLQQSERGVNIVKKNDGTVEKRIVK